MGLIDKLTINGDIEAQRFIGDASLLTGWPIALGADPFSVHLDQTTPQTTIGTFHFPSIQLNASGNIFDNVNFFLGADQAGWYQLQLGGGQGSVGNILGTSLILGDGSAIFANGSILLGSQTSNTGLGSLQLGSVSQAKDGYLSIFNHNGGEFAKINGFDGTAMFANNATTIDSLGNLTANSLIKTGGLSTQFLKADGSVDGNTYLQGTIPASSAMLGSDGSSNLVDNSLAYYVLDLWNPNIRTNPGDFTLIGRNYSPFATPFFKKYSNTITIGTSGHWGQTVICPLLPSNGGVIKLGVAGALNMAVINTTYGTCDFDLNGYDIQFTVPSTSYSYTPRFINTGATATLNLQGAASSLTCYVNLAKAPNDMNVNQIGNSGCSFTWVGTHSITGTYTIGAGNTLIDNAGVLISNMSSIIFQTGSASTFKHSTIDFSAKFSFAANSNPTLYNNTQNVNLASAFGSSVNVPVIFSGASAAYYTNVTGNNTWSGLTTIQSNAFVKFGHANCMGTNAGLTFSGTPITIDNSSGSPLTMTKNVTLSMSAGTLTFSGTNNLTFTGTHVLSAAQTISVAANQLIWNGAFSGNFIITKSGAGYMYINQTAGGLTVSGGTAGCNIIGGALVLSNTAGVIFNAEATNGINTTSTTVNFGGANARVAFAWNAGVSRFTYITPSSTVALATVGMNFSGSPTNGTYDIVIASGTMSGTLPTIQSNTTGKTLVLSQVGNTLKVTVS